MHRSPGGLKYVQQIDVRNMLHNHFSKVESHCYASMPASACKVYNASPVLLIALQSHACLVHPHHSDSVVIWISKGLHAQRPYGEGAKRRLAWPLVAREEDCRCCGESQAAKKSQKNSRRAVLGEIQA